MQWTSWRKTAFLLLGVLASVFVSKNTSAQGITASTTEGCAPLAGVQFNNSFMSPTGITWNFGDGASSNLPSPNHSFANPGSYTVTFSATVNGSPVNASLTITVYAAPQVAFSVNPSGVCLGQSVQFSDQSTGGSGSAMTGWQWNFGDGTPISTGSANPTKTYTNPGQYTVTLIATDANGCQGTATINQAVAISTPPTLNIITTPSPVLACEPPLTVSFANTSTSNSPTGGGLTWNWNFGNGQTSTAAIPPPVTYTTQGTFTIAVTATDNVGCTATQNIPVSVQQPTAEITALDGQNGVWCSEVNFQITGTQGGSFNYGNGITGFLPFHNYANPGNYTVTYTVSTQGCSASASTNITVEIPTATISSTPGYTCSLPVDFSYTASASSPIAEYTWTLWDDSVTTIPNPLIEVDLPGLSPYAINGLITWTNILEFTTVNGCNGIATKIDSLALPNARFHPDKTDGCAPLTVNYEDYSSMFEVNQLVSWEWHFGDGTVTTQTQSTDPVHTYNNPGEYSAFLVVTNEVGCVDTSFAHLIEVGTPVTPGFSINPNDVCPNTAIQVTNTSPDAALIDFYNYQADGATHFSCADEASPTVTFNTEAGSSVAITQTLVYNGCSTSLTQNVTVRGPIAKLSYDCNCDSPLEYVFIVEPEDAEQWSVDFGDGNSVSNTNALSIPHTYDNVQNVEVVLTASNSSTGCPSFNDTLLVKVRNLEVTLNAPDNVCSGSIANLSVNAGGGTLEPADFCNPRYAFYFNDGTRPIQTHLSNIEHLYQGSGTTTLEVYVKDDNECLVKAEKEIKLFNITANYSADTLTGCPPFDVAFTDLSVSDTTLTSWSWNFGSPGGNSNAQNPGHTYNDSPFGTNNQPLPYTVSLTVTDALGCTDNISTLVIQPLGPNPAFQTTSPGNVCEGDQVNFSPTASNINFHTYAWDFGNGLTSEGPGGSSIFAEAGSYTITLEVTDTTGCTRARTQQLVNVQAYPEAIISPDYGPDDVLCYPVAINFTDASVVSPFGSRSWNLGAGGPPLSIPVVGNTYLLPGLYTVTLNVQTTFGCEDIDTLQVQVEGPLAELNINPLAICPGGGITVALTDTSDLAFWKIDFGDGQDTSNVFPVGHDYAPTFIPASGGTVVTLVMYSPDSACASARTEPLIIEQVIAGFNRNAEAAATDSIHCFGIADNFVNTSSANATAFNWSLSTGQVFNTPNPPQINLPVGTHTITLIVNSNLGCADTIAKNMTIHPLPTPEVNEGEICFGESIALTATGGIAYSWQPPAGLNTTTGPDVQASPSSSTTYTVLVTDINDCSASASSFIFVHQPPPSVERDTILRIGDSALAGLNLGNTFTYTWSPDIEISCTDCPVATFTPLEDREYTLTIEDAKGCFAIDSYFFFEILPVASVDVPQAFSPNGDGVNDILYAKGWGIERLLSFRIYNRWGELVFETDDINQGWDGRYKGEIQNPDSYAYVVVVKNYILEEPQMLKGFVDIVR